MIDDEGIDCSVLECLFENALGHLGDGGPVWPRKDAGKKVKGAVRVLFYLGLVKVDKKCDGGFRHTRLLSLTLANLGSARESLFCRVNGYGAEFCHCLGLAVTVKKLTRPVFPASNDANPLNFW